MGGKLKKDLKPLLPEPFRRGECFGRIIPVHRLSPEVMGEHAAGFFDPNIQAIALSSDISGLELERVLMHEMFHATLDRLYLDAELDNKFVEALIENLVGVVFDNWRLKWRK